jgi:hypothetical protein
LNPGPGGTPDLIEKCKPLIAISSSVIWLFKCVSVKNTMSNSSIKLVI